MKTLILISLLLASCSGYNHFSGGGKIVGLSRYAPDHKNLQQRVSDNEAYTEQSDSLIVKKSIDLPVQQLNDEFQLMEDHQMENIHITNKSDIYPESETVQRNQVQSPEKLESKKQKRPIEPVGLIGFILATLSLVAGVLLLLELHGGGGSLLILAGIALAALILGVISYFIIRKNPSKYRLPWFAEASIIISGVVIGIGIVVIPVVVAILNFIEFLKW